ncbi:MAG: DUF1598 domain-containing protein [Bythopirellula sp.]|nr:DUF1598 domain-containing protein [Bythopirellula sp.]
MYLDKTFARCIKLAFVGWLCLATNLPAQQPAPPQGNQAPGNQGLGNVGFFGGPDPAGLFPGAPGGAANADFDSLIDLIQSTVAYDSWMENGSGEGEIQPFAINGVYADPQGTLRFDRALLASTSLRREPTATSDKQPANARQSSPLRYVSLPRLENAIAAHQVAHKPLPAEMLTLAGLERIEYVILNPETHDLILAGPAGDWRVGEAGILVSVATGRPVVRLDDLLALWRRQGAAAFGCSITPRQQALADTQEFLTLSAAKPLEPSKRQDWLDKLRDTLGKQDVEFFGVVPESHMAMVLLVADYHMKLIGMGLAESVGGVTNYLETVELLADGSAPPMSVLRWWFAMADRPVKTNAERDVYQIPAGGVRVLSENELLAARGQRIHTNQSDALNRRFAETFTAEFTSLAEKYPLYGELQNVFGLSLVLALIDREDLLARSGWQPTLFETADSLRLPQLAVPREVETVINHRVINKRQIIAGISGGVWIDAPRSLKIEKADGSELNAAKSSTPPTGQRWWWD